MAPKKSKSLRAFKSTSSDEGRKPTNVKFSLKKPKKDSSDDSESDDMPKKKKDKKKDKKNKKQDSSDDSDSDLDIPKKKINIRKTDSDDSESDDIPKKKKDKKNKKQDSSDDSDSDLDIPKNKKDKKNEKIVVIRGKNKKEETDSDFDKLENNVIVNNDDRLVEISSKMDTIIKLIESNNVETLLNGIELFASKFISELQKKHSSEKMLEIIDGFDKSVNESDGCIIIGSNKSIENMLRCEIDDDHIKKILNSETKVKTYQSLSQIVEPIINYKD
jgi:hypothetical protein